MRILVTAGGTAEQIDDVRSITNHATGRLGANIADRFVKAGDQVIYVMGKESARPKHKEVIKYVVSNVESLYQTIEVLLKENQFDAIVHSMAVGDYQISHIKTAQDVLSKQHKIDSNNQIEIVLKKAPKVINQFKKIQPQAILIGFKLLSQVSQETLFNAAKAMMNKSGSDYVFANDLRDINEKQHKGYLINKDGTYQEAYTKRQIANLIYKTIRKG